MSRRRHTQRPIPCAPPPVDPAPAARGFSGRFLSRFHSRVAVRTVRETVSRPGGLAAIPTPTSCPSEDLAETAR